MIPFFPELYDRCTVSSLVYGVLRIDWQQEDANDAYQIIISRIVRRYVSYSSVNPVSSRSRPSHGALLHSSDSFAKRLHFT